MASEPVLSSAYIGAVLHTLAHRYQYDAAHVCVVESLTGVCSVSLRSPDLAFEALLSLPCAAPPADAVVVTYALVGMEQPPVAWGDQGGVVVLQVGSSCVRIFITSESMGQWDAETVTQHIENILLEASRNPFVCIWDVDIFTDLEKETLKSMHRQADVSQIPHETVVSQFARQAQLHNDKIAIWSPTRTLTYSETWKVVVKYALRLKGLGVLRGSRVALCVPEGEEMVVWVMAILVAGGTIVPVDPCHPITRIQYVFEDSQISLAIMSRDARIEPIEGITVLLADQDAMDSAEETINVDDIRIEDESHVVYTSGTTGRPKGVRCTHGNLSTYAWAKNASHGVSVGSRVFVASAFTFDPCLGDVISTLSVGGTTCVAPRSEIIGDLAAILVECKATHVLSTPALWATVEKGPQSMPDLRVVALGGEAMSVNMVSKWSKHVKLCNTYGVTEATVYQTLRQIDVGDSPRLIGWPFSTVQFRIVNSFMVDMPLGQVGELIIGGPQVANGYTTPDARSSFFEDNRLQKWYRTGDMAHLIRAGVVLNGRIDFQVKINGQRVELDEIASVAEECAFVTRAVVILHESGQLVCYVAVDEGCSLQTNNRIKEHSNGSRCAAEYAVQLHCERVLPRHMVPHVVLAMETLPMTSTNKIDRGALPPLPERQDVLATLTPMEQMVAKAWAGILGIAAESLSPTDHFGRVGGDSLAALRVARLLRRETIGEESAEKLDEIMGIIRGCFAPKEFIKRPILSEYARYLEDHLHGYGETDGLQEAARTPEDAASEAVVTLIECARMGYSKVMVDLLSSGVFPNGAWTKHNHCVSPLHVAAAHGQIECVKILLQNGAKVNVVDKNQCLPVHYAAGKSLSALQVLLEHGAAARARDYNKQSLIHWAARTGMNDILRFICQHIPVLGLDEFDRWGRTAIHWAALNGHADTIKVCLELGADPRTHLPDNRQERRTRLVNETPLHLASRHGHIDVCRILLNAGVDPCAKDALGSLPRIPEEIIKEFQLDTQN